MPPTEGVATDIVICAHNEEATLAKVLAAVAAAPSRGRIIVVADACTDRTEEIAGELADLVVPVAVRDKGSAMAAGLRQVGTENVAFCDADLEGLLPAHVEALLGHRPSRCMVVGLRDGHRRIFGRLPPISGERRVPTSLASEARLEATGWQAELRLNATAARAGLPWYHLVLVGVRNPRRPKASEWAQLAQAAAGYGSPLLRYVAQGRKVT